MTQVTDFTVIVVTANIRDVDGCDSDAAIAKIMEAAQQAADQFAVDNECNIELVEPEFPRDRQSRTIIVGFDVPHDYDDARDAMKTAQEIEYAVGDAIDEAIQAGDWQDAAAAAQKRGKQQGGIFSMTTITNAAGKEIDFEAASNLMDNDLSADLDHGAGLTEQEFFDAYCGKHRAKFGEEFEPNKANPVW